MCSSMATFFLHKLLKHGAQNKVENVAENEQQPPPAVAEPSAKAGGHNNLIKDILVGASRTNLPHECIQTVEPDKASVSTVTSDKRLELKEAIDRRARYRALVRMRRLMKELKDIRRRMEKGSPVFTVELDNDNLYEWNVKLLQVDKDSQLYHDMAAHNITSIDLHLSFPENFPFAPPFMYVMTPRIENGFILDGGAICLELLTTQGWVSAYTIEALILQFASSLSKGSARLAKKQKRVPFNKKTAEAAFEELVMTHEKYGWVSPPMAEG